MTIPDRPLTLLPRWAALALLLATLVASVWNGFALETRNTAHEADIEQRLERGESVDMDLYRYVHARVRGGADYYAAATAGNRKLSYPTKPFVTIRTPFLAWGSALWGDLGWRVVAVILWSANIIAWFAAAGPRVGRRERDAAGTLVALFGAAAFIPEVAFSHELIGGLMVSLALALSASRWWLAGLVIALLAVGVRELALPFLVAWLTIAALAGRRDQIIATSIALAMTGIGLWLHANAVAAAQLPGDEVSPGWQGLLGPSLPLYGIHVTTLLQTLPVWLAGPLGVLPLLGWFAVGGRLGALASLWFAGFIAAVAIFARQENFYWMGLFVPAYGVGLAFVPRALADLVAAVRREAPASPTPA